MLFGCQLVSCVVVFSLGVTMVILFTDCHTLLSKLVRIICGRIKHTPKLIIIVFVTSYILAINLYKSYGDVFLTILWTLRVI